MLRYLHCGSGYQNAVTHSGRTNTIYVISFQVEEGLAYLSIYLSVKLFIYLSIYLSIYISLYVYLNIYIYTYLYIYYMILYFSGSPPSPTAELSFYGPP